MNTKIQVKTNEIFKPVHQSTKRYIMLKGSAGSGKSVDTAQMYILRLLKDKGRNLLCVRKSDVTHKDSTFAELISAYTRMGLERYFDFTTSPLRIVCVNGNEIVFRGANDPKQREKLKSISFRRGKLTDVWIEELTELDIDDFEIIDDRLRGELPKGLFYQIKGTFNPVNSSHWVKRKFFDKLSDDCLTHHSTYLDNAFIDEAYKRRMQRRAVEDPDGYRIYGLGEWGEVGGLVFTNWSVDDISQSHSDYDDIAYGQDFGYNHANCILELGYKDGDVYILRELYLFEKTTREIIGHASHFSQDIPMWCDSAEPDRIREWQESGFNAKAVVKEGRKRNHGKRLINAQIDWLKARKIFVHPSCKNTIKEFQQWKWQKDRLTGDYIDSPVNFQDDAMSALRYGVESWRKPNDFQINFFKGGI